jgi:hypothetical protein
MEPWFKVTQPRAEVTGGRSFNPDEFAIALEMVAAGTAPEDYRDAAKFFSRTYFTRALIEHAGMVLRRLGGETENTAPVLTLITQFGGGKTHTLTSLYHLIKHPEQAMRDAGVQRLLQSVRLPEIPPAQVAVFVGNAWDPTEGRHTPWLDIAWQLAGPQGIAALGPQANTTPPGTEALQRLFNAAGGRVLLLLDEVLNYINRYRGEADSFYAFLQNLTVAMTGMPHSAAVISLPRSQVEMTDRDREWQDRLTKIVRRVAKDLIANDEREISEVVRRRLFESLGRESIRRRVASEYADWCFERRAQLPPEWTAVDSASSESHARELLVARFESCYPFHPATLTVFQRKWQALHQYQQTRGTLAMLAQWISWAFRDGYTHARREALITLGSAPLEIPEFRATVLGQLGESRLEAAILADLAGSTNRAAGLDIDSQGPLRDIHKRVGTAILFESSGGMTDKYAHLPDLRFALGEPEIDTTTIDTAALALEEHGFFLRKAGTDGFRFGFKPTLKKVVNDRRAALDGSPGGEIDQAINAVVKAEFEKDRASMQVHCFPADATAIPDSPRLTLVVMPPSVEWDETGSTREQLAAWTYQRAQSPRLYPGAIIWCIRQRGKGIREKAEQWLAWRRVSNEVREGTLGSEFDQHEVADVQANVTTAEHEMRDEVWASYRFILLADAREPSGMKWIDLGAGHASSGETLAKRVITALKSEGLLNDSIGAGYLDRNWPTALRESGAWPLQGLRQSFVNGTLTRLRDPDTVLKQQLANFVARGDFGLASGQQPDGTYDRMWFQESVSEDEIVFDSQVFLMRRDRAVALRTQPTPEPESPVLVTPTPPTITPPTGGDTPVPPLIDVPTTTTATTSRLKLGGSIPLELWNRFGRILPKLHAGENLTLHIEASVDIRTTDAETIRRELEQALADLGIAGTMRVRVNGQQE